MGAVVQSRTFAKKIFFKYLIFYLIFIKYHGFRVQIQKIIDFDKKTKKLQHFKINRVDLKKHIFKNFIQLHPDLVFMAFLAK